MYKTNLKILAIVDNLSKVLKEVDDQLDAEGCPMKTRMQIDIAVEELFVNIANYAYSPDIGDADISIEILDECPIPEKNRENLSPQDISGKWLRVTMSDSGTPFDPLQKEDPDVTLPAEEREIGGLGIFIVKKTMDSVCYRRNGENNELAITKTL